MSIIVLGTVALDNVKTPCGTRKDMLGGSASHFSMAARLFTDVHLVAVIGEDFPKRYIDFLKKKGIILDSVEMMSGNSFKWEGRYEGDLNTAITLNTHLGVLSSFDPHVTPDEKNIGNIFLANIDPDIQMRLLKMMRRPRLVGLDSMNYWIKNKKPALLKILKNTDIYLANEGEARELSGENNLLKAAAALRRMGPAMVVIKKGEHGVMFFSDEFIFPLPAYPIERIVDPTGAGDTFAGGFMGYLSRCGSLKKADIKKAVAYGTVCASFNVQGFGLERTSRLKIQEVNTRLRRFKDCVTF
jgi:sugar/nucleoside kinase (ribokinase family)